MNDEEQNWLIIHKVQIQNVKTICALTFGGTFCFIQAHEPKKSVSFLTAAAEKSEEQEINKQNRLNFGVRFKPWHRN